MQIHICPKVAAGKLPIRTVVGKGNKGPPTCGIGTTTGVCIGHICISVALAAGNILFS